MGDVNLDFIKWINPEPGVAKMVEKVKNEIETLGFQQMIHGTTRTWKDQPDSNLDHVWMNNPGRLIFLQKSRKSFFRS